MSGDRDQLYAFLHIPKTAGSTLRYHIEKYLSEDKRLYLGAEVVGLWDKNKENSFGELRSAVEDHILGLSKQRKGKIKVIYGHEVIYGLQKYFDKPIRYFTFLRDPVARTVSHYNHYREQYGQFVKDGIDTEDLQHNFLVNGKIPDFKKWLMIKYNPKGKRSYLTMFQRLILNGFIKEEEVKNINPKKILDKFWFVGSVDSFNNDSLYLYQKLGINAFFVDQNISKKYFKLRKRDPLYKEIVRRNKNDIKLFKKVKEKYAKFKNDNQDFETVISKQRLKRKLILPFTQTVYAPRDTLKILLSRLAQHR